MIASLDLLQTLIFIADDKVLSDALYSLKLISESPDNLDLIFDSNIVCPKIMHYI